MNCPYCQAPTERITYLEEPLPGFDVDVVRVTLWFCELCGMVDRAAEMVVPV